VTEVNFDPARATPPLRSIIWRCLTSAGIRTGDGQFSRDPVSLLSSNKKFIDWDSRCRPVQILVPYDTGASVIAIDAMCRNGCCVHGGSMWTRVSAIRRRTERG
jgi:hypothetical protein